MLSVFLLLTSFNLLDAPLKPVLTMLSLRGKKEKEETKFSTH